MPENQQDGRANWVTIASYSSGLEADIARQRLEAEGIPVLVSSNAPGIFGASFQGNVTGGVTLQVPSPVVSRARAMLDNSMVDDDEFDEY